MSHHQQNRFGDVVIRDVSGSTVTIGNQNPSARELSVEDHMVIQQRRAEAQERIEARKSRSKMIVAIIAFVGVMGLMKFCPEALPMLVKEIATQLVAHAHPTSPSP